MKYYLILFILMAHAGRAQQFTVYGSVADSLDNTSLIGVNLILLQASDTTQRNGVITDNEGKFVFNAVIPGRYVVRISYVGYTSVIRSLTVHERDVNLGLVKIGEATTTLENVVIKAVAIPVEQKGDTVQYNANAFKTNRDATAEDLIQKMPGITSDNTGVKAQGETVQQVLVDGKQFFGDDATLALKNLPAEIIDKIEVFDRLSEQSQFTGFDDGQTRKTLNIVTRKGKNNGQFGRVYAGGGENGHYTVGGNLNSFRGNQKISVVGISNNINQQNFSTEDLLGVTGSGAGGRGGRPGAGNSSSNFNIGQQSGIATTNALGLNYTDQWNKKIQVTGSYFFNKADNKQITNINRQYITQQDSGLVYTEASMAKNTNYNHRLNMRLEYTIDTANSIVITPKLSYQGNNSKSSLSGRYAGATDAVRNNIDNTNGTNATGYNFANSVLYRHRFTKRGRSFSWNINTEINSKNGDTDLHSVNANENTSETKLIDQQANQSTQGNTLSTSLSYTEPLGKKSQLQVNYSPSFMKNNTNKDTYNRTPETGSYDVLDTVLTNRFENTYVTQKGGVSYRFNDRKLNFRTELNGQQARLNSRQEFPTAAHVNKTFENFLPQASFNYKFIKTRNLRVNYRTSTNAPSVSQLQNVIDNRNPLFLTAGNTALKQNYSHAITARYGSTNIEKSTSFLFYVSGNLVNNYITNSTFIAPRDTIFRGVTLARGAQLSYPVNINGYSSTQALLTYGMPVAPLKSNVNLSVGLTYNRTPGLINSTQNLANNVAFTEGIVIGSNISEKVDFTLTYNGNYTIVKNTIQKQSDNNYYNHLASLKFNWLFYKGFVLNTTLNNTVYKGLSAQYDQSIWFWNASMGYKFLKDQRLEIKVTAFDLLNENKSIARNVTATYIEDQRTNVLNRYFMLILTYSLRRFK